MNYDIWVDFNSMTDDRQVLTLRKFAARPEALEVGQALVAGDDEGNVCSAVVVSQEGDSVCLALDMESWPDAERRRIARRRPPSWADEQ